MDNDNEDEMLARFRQYRASRDPVLRDELYAALEHRYDGLLHFWASYYQARNWTMDDKLQEGRIGLMRVVERYDPDGLHQQKPLNTVTAFAVRKSIYNAMKDDIADQDTIPMSLTIPDTYAPDWMQDRVTRELPSLASLEPSVEEQVMRTVDGAQVGSTLEAALLLLSERQRTIIERRYGLGGDGHVWTLEEVGRLLGLHKSNVCRQQQKALGILRAQLLQSDDGVLALRTLNERQRATLASQRKKVA